MTNEFIKSIVLEWNNEIQWLDDEVNYLGMLLSSICEMNHGTIYEDTEIAQDKIIQYKTDRINDILSSYASKLVRRHFTEATPMCRSKTRNFVVDLPFLESKEQIPRTNLNLARNKELEKLPGIGKVTAERIINYRKRKGGIRRITELKNIRGISSNEISKFAHKVYLKKTGISRIKLQHDDELVRNPSFKNYVNFMLENEILISKYCENPANLKELIIREIEGIASNLELKPRLWGYSPGMRTSKIEQNLKENQELQEYTGTNHDIDTHGALLRDAHYYYFIIELLKTAQNRIRIIMFFFTYSEDHPSKLFMDEIIKAKNRGVEIKVILDHQAEDDPKPSRIVNKNAFDFLKTNNIPVTFDTEEIATHTKLLIVDDVHVVIGSHNWTAGSFFNYRDTSVYINSKKLSDYYYSTFDTLWEEYTNNQS